MDLGCWPRYCVMLRSQGMNWKSYLLKRRCRPTSPSIGQATTSPLLRRLKLLACHSGAVFKAWPGFLLQKRFWRMRRWVPGADGWGPAWWRHGEMERARGRIGSLRFSATSCTAQQLNAQRQRQVQSLRLLPEISAPPRPSSRSCLQGRGIEHHPHNALPYATCSVLRGVRKSTGLPAVTMASV